MIQKNTNVIRLRRAGILKKGAKLSEHDVDVLSRLSKAEVTAVISAKRKLGAGFIRRHVHKAELIF